MSIMVIYGNNKTASIIVDCRATCTMPDGAIQYYERACKIHKYNKTLVGIIGDGKYAEKIYDSIKNSEYFPNSKAFVTARYEEIYDLCMKYSIQYKNEYFGDGCLICIAGINKDNKIILNYFHTSDYEVHTTIPETSEYASKVFCNYNEIHMEQLVHNIVNTTDERLIPFTIHNTILEEVLPNDNTINNNWTIETITL